MACVSPCCMGPLGLPLARSQLSCIIPGQDAATGEGQAQEWAKGDCPCRAHVPGAPGPAREGAEAGGRTCCVPGAPLCAVTGATAGI